MSTLPASLNRLLPLVAIGTVADCQSIIDPTNRALVQAGLQIFNNKSHKITGLTELLEQTGLNKKMQQGYKLNSQDLGYTLSPILNSSGRLSHARLSIATILQSEAGIHSKIYENHELLHNSVSELAALLVATNQERKQTVKDCLGEVETEAKLQYERGDKMLWLQGNWSKGIVGLLASRLVNQYNLPVVVVSESVESG